MNKNFSKKIKSIILVAVICGGCSSANSLRIISMYDGAVLYTTTTSQGDGHIKVIKLNGSFTDMGKQYGYLLKDNLAAYYQDIILNYLIAEKGHTYDELLTTAVASYATALQETQDFMQGAAETSGLTIAQIQLINISLVGAIYGCSAVAAWGEHTGGGPLVLGRNWDMVPLDRFKDYMMVVVYNPSSGNSVADINYMGEFQTFQSAMNNKGLWIDLQDGSMMSSATDATKQDANKAILQFLMNDSTMDELNASFMANGSDASFVMTVADPNVAYSYFWCTQGTYKFTEADQSGLLATSNHFVEYPNTWTINALPTDPATQAYTELRRNNWIDLANSSTYNGLLTADTMKTMLETTIPDGGGSFPTSGYADETVYQIVAVPQTRVIWIRLPKYYSWEQIDLSGLFN